MLLIDISYFLFDGCITSMSVSKQRHFASVLPEHVPFDLSFIFSLSSAASLDSVLDFSRDAVLLKVIPIIQRDYWGKGGGEQDIKVNLYFSLVLLSQYCTKYYDFLGGRGGGSLVER